MRVFKILLAAVCFTALLGVVGVVAGPEPSTKPLVETSHTAVKAANITFKQETETRFLAFGTQTINDATLAKGQTKVTQVGINGVKTYTYKVTYQNGVKTSRELVSERITTPVVDQITHIGTYVAPISCRGGYINVDGNCIPSPSTSPSGATAKCRDGTYSYSQNHRGTCSHHGGVARWL